jgi:Flp pilus assembly protein TadD
MKRAIQTAAMVFALLDSTAYAASYCGDLKTSFGPFDYRRRSESATNLQLVESAHFTPEVEKLTAGNTGTIAGDLSYTLVVFPNHARALSSLARLALQTKATKTTGLKYSFECYFDRAVRFQPDDPAPRSIYGAYLLRKGRTDDALEQLSEAVALAPDDPSANYNLGLGYFEKKDYEQAKLYAKKAYALGFPLQGLKTKLTKVNKWGAGDD